MTDTRPDSPRSRPAGGFAGPVSRKVVSRGQNGRRARLGIGGKIAEQLYRSVALLRRTEEVLAEAYLQGEMQTPTHFGIGQEAVAAGVIAALETQDVVYSHHRCHNHYLAKGGGVVELAAELLGREAGCSRGRGGSVHLTAREQGFIATSAILGEMIPVAVGSAFSFKMDKLRRVAVTFFGEAACEEGVFYESLNFASIHRLPVLFVCENNLYSTESPLSVRQPPGTDLCERVRSFKVRAERVDGNDVIAVYSAGRRAVKRLHAGEGPVFLECMTYRWREHVGPHLDHELGRSYRTKAELQTWMNRCPVEQARKKLLEAGWATADVIDGWNAEIEAHVQAAIMTARKSAWPQAGAMLDNVY